MQRGLAVLMGFIGLFMVASSAHAIPVFARKYKTTCMTCHTSPTMLNDFGLRFQTNGYQLPGTVDSTPVWELDQVPIAFMLHAVWNWMESRQELEPGEFLEETTFGFSEPHGNLFSGGTLGAHLSYFTRLNLEPQGISVDTMYVIWNNVVRSSILNFRVGRFYLDVPFPQRLSLTEDIVPLVYAFSGLQLEEVHKEGEDHLETAHAPLLRSRGFPIRALQQDHVHGGIEEHVVGPTGTVLARSQLGLSAFGFVPYIFDGLRYEVALTRWHKGKRPDVFVRLNQTVYVRNAPFRVGLLYFNGRNQLEDLQFESDFWRFGVDVELYDPWTKVVNVQFQWITGRDGDVELEPGPQEREMSGGLIGTHVFLIPEKLVLHGRYEWLNASPEERRRWVGVFRYHFTNNMFIDFIFHRWTSTVERVVHHEEAHEEHIGAPFYSMVEVHEEEFERFFEKRRTSMFMIMFMFIF